MIHSRPRSGSRPRRFSLLSEKSGLSEPLGSLSHTWMGPAPHSQDMPAQLGSLGAGDDVEKKVHMNEDGSLSVEMKVRFQLLGDDMLLWSRRVGGPGTLPAASGEDPVLGEVDPLHGVLEGHPGNSSEPGEAGCKETFERGRWQPGSRYEIWTNPLYTGLGEGTASQRRAGRTRHSHSRGLWSQGVSGGKRSIEDSASIASSDRPPEGSEPSSSRCSRSQEGSVGSCGLRLAPGADFQKRAGWEAGGTAQAGEGPGPEGAGPGSREHRCLQPRTHGVARALSDSSVSTGPHEASSERGEQHRGHLSKTRTVTSLWRATERGGPSSPTPSASSLRSKDPQGEESGQGTKHPQDRGGSGTRLPQAAGHRGSGDTAGGCSPPSACASAVGGRRKQGSRASAVSSPSVSGLGRGAQRGCPRQHHNRKNAHRPLHSPVSRRRPGPPSLSRAHPVARSPAPRNRASRGAGPPSSASLHSQDARGVSSAPFTPVSDSDCASHFYPPYSPSAETEGDPEFRAHSVTLTPSSLFRSQADGLGEKAWGDAPKPPWSLVLPDGQDKGEKPEFPQGCRCSQTGTSSVPGTPGGETRALQLPQPQGSQEPLSEACSVCSRYCPRPPRAQPSVKKQPSGSSSHSGGDHSADRGPGGAKPGEEKLDLQHPRPPGSRSRARGEALRAPRRGSPGLGPRPSRVFQGQATGAEEGSQEQADGGRVSPGALPRASPEAVVREWLNNIPEQPVPMDYEMVDDSTEVAGDGQESPTEDPVEQHSSEGLGEPSQPRGPSPEGTANEEAEPDGALPVTGDAGPQSAESPPHGRISEAPKEAGAGGGSAGDGGPGQCVLPHRVSASIQIMKALMGSKQGRPSSLPEVSSAVGRRLSHSAQALITCLARLRFFDEDRGSPTHKARFTDSPRYQELLSTFQTLWPGCGLRRGELDSHLWELGGCQALSCLRSHAVTEDFTPTSSSGVDVGSGSGGSGDGSGPCAVDCTPVSERTELPLKIPYQRPDSRTSENPVGLENQQPSGSTASSSSRAPACATGKEGAEGHSGEQTLDSDLDRAAENTVQEVGVQLEKTREEKERAELQGDGVGGFPEEGQAVGQEPSGAGRQDAEGARGGERVQEEEAGRDPGEGKDPTETAGNLTERDLNASGRQSDPNTESSLEKLPTAARMDREQTQTKFTQGAGEKGPSMAHRVSLDPDSLWVSRLLRKMEKAFMAHLASATAELRARWSLPSDDLLDQMVAELQQDVRQRLHDSTEKELQKIQSRAGGKARGPPRGALRWETSLQTEQRRRRLQGLRNLSAFSEQTWARGSPSLSQEDVPALSEAPETPLGREAEGEEFCPCEACAKKNVIPASPKDTMGIACTPIKEAFDLKQILQKKKGGCAHEEIAEVAPEKTGMELLHRDPLGTGTVQGGDGGLEDEDDGKGSQTLSRGEDPESGEENVATEKVEGSMDPCEGCRREAAEWEEQGVSDKEENLEEGSGAEVSVEGEASGGGDRSPGGQNDGPDAVEAQETEGEEQPESRGGDQGEKERKLQVGPRQGQSGDASGCSSPDQQGRPTPPPAPGGDDPGQRSGLKTAPSSSRTSSLGNCSQLSQKGSEEEPSKGDMRTAADEPKGVPGPERTVISMYPEGSTSEQEGSTSGSRTPERGTEEGLTPEPGAGQGKVIKSLTWTETRVKNLSTNTTDGFGQDDLDF